MSEKVGAVMVVGAGISGIQSALDLADSGFKVYLVDSKPSIGGLMSQLDKTFPTNDCSMCIEAPKMVDAGRHQNIELLTYSELVSVEGEDGNFHAKILKKPRSVDIDKCTGCGLCTENCPIMLKIQIPEKPPAPEVRDRELIDGFISEHADLPNPLIQILLDVSGKYSYLPRDVLEYLAFRLEIPFSNIYRIATFYKSFSLEKRGDYHVKVCLGTACHVRGGSRVLDKVRTVADIYGGDTFSIETVNCLGACALGPIIVVNEEVHGHVTIDGVDKVMNELGASKAEGGEEE
ncbi:MAG: NAD(P)H-dependent oxidoreductase subunit E [Thermoplasmata archaeon]|nr:NAD(P)H-dependent oxidoreductase subunit E [Thermoplasmata archaeon]